VPRLLIYRCDLGHTEDDTCECADSNELRAELEAVDWDNGRCVEVAATVRGVPVVLTKSETERALELMDDEAAEDRRTWPRWRLARWEVDYR